MKEIYTLSERQKTLFHKTLESLIMVVECKNENGIVLPFIETLSKMNKILACLKLDFSNKFNCKEENFKNLEAIVKQVDFAIENNIIEEIRLFLPNLQDEQDFYFLLGRLKNLIREIWTMQSSIERIREVFDTLEKEQYLNQVVMKNPIPNSVISFFDRPSIFGCVWFDSFKSCLRNLSLILAKLYQILLLDLETVVHFQNKNTLQNGLVGEISPKENVLEFKVSGLKLIQSLTYEEMNCYTNSKSSLHE